MEIETFNEPIVYDKPRRGRPPKPPGRVDPQALLDQEFTEALAQARSLRKVIDEQRRIILGNMAAAPPPPQVRLEVLSSLADLYTKLTNAAEKLGKTLAALRKDGGGSELEGVDLKDLLA